MNYIKSLIWTIVRMFSIPYFFIFRPQKNVLTIFLYHDVGDTPSEFAASNHLNVSNKTFKSQVDWISNHFNVIHPNDLLNNKKLPRSPALITFDDGFLGAFENGISHLMSRNIPSLMFLNMNSILTGKPILASVAHYVSEKHPGFEKFAERQGLSRPYQLSFSPYYYDLFVKEFGAIDESKVLNYQGKIASESIVRQYNDRNLIVNGNHLFEHWNAAILTDSEFITNYTSNELALARLDNAVSMFGFPFGQPYACFTQKHVDSLHKMGAKKAFYSAGGVNPDNDAFLLNRLGLTELDNSHAKFLRRVLSALFLKTKPFEKN